MKAAPNIRELGGFCLHGLPPCHITVFQKLRVSKAKAAELKWLRIVSTVLHDCFDWGAHPLAYVNPCAISKFERLDSLPACANFK